MWKKTAFPLAKFIYLLIIADFVLLTIIFIQFGWFYFTSSICLLLKIETIECVNIYRYVYTSST